MAGEIIPEGGAPATAEAPVQAVEPAAAPAVPVEGVVEAAPAAEPAPVAEDGAAPAEAAAEAGAEPEKTAKGEAKPDAAAEEPAPAPVYEAFKLPEGIQAAPEQVEAFTSVLGKYGLTQEAGQELMNLHAEGLQSMAKAMEQRQIDAFSDTRRTWREDFFKTAGNKADTTLNDAKALITETIKDTKERQAFWDVLNFTGAGDNRHVISTMAKIARRLRERPAPGPGLPVDPNRSMSAADKRYNKTSR